MSAPSGHQHVRPSTRTTRVNTATEAWLQLFRMPPSRHQVVSHVEPIDTSVDASFATTLPPVGGDYVVATMLPWPSGVHPIASSVFAVTRPYPVARRSQPNATCCYCYSRCVPHGGSALGSDCLNIASCWVCDSNNCLLGSACGNRFEQQYTFDLIQARVGVGVICSESIPRGAFVVEYIGEVLLAEDADERNNKRYQAELRTKSYWEGQMGVVIDAINCGNASRFMNHSCDPNCIMFDYNWANTSRLGIFALRDIPALQELTFTYRERSRTQFECRCGKPMCASN